MDNSFLEDDLYWRFRDLVQAHSGLYFPEKKRRELQLALSKALPDAPAAVAGPEAYYRYLRYATTAEARQEIARFINLLTIRETHLFRDSAQFDALATQVLPALIARKRELAANLGVTANGDTQVVLPQLRLWSAGCSTGEEAYSLAILLCELIPDIAQWRILILATDINEEALAQARQATYSEWSFRESRARALRPRYFTACTNGYQLRPEVRRLVTFARHNLATDQFPAVATNTVSMDLIVCRNVTIYFAPELTHRLAACFYQTLATGGWLVVGHAEPSLATYSAFTGHMLQGTLLYQKQAPAIPSRPAPQETTSPPRALSPPRRTDWLTPLPPPAVMAPDSEPYEAARLWLSHGRVEPAINQLEKIIAENERSAAARCLLARAYADLGQWQKARAACESAIAVDPLLPEVYYVLAMIEEHEGRLDPAIANLKKVVYLDQERPLAYFNLALLYKKRAQADLAQRALKTVIYRTRAWPADHIIPDSGHTSVQRLLGAAWQLLEEIERSSGDDSHRPGIQP